MRQPGIEPGSTAWKAAMLTTIPLTLLIRYLLGSKYTSVPDIQYSQNRISWHMYEGTCPIIFKLLLLRTESFLNFYPIHCSILYKG